MIAEVAAKCAEDLSIAQLIDNHIGMIFVLFLIWIFFKD